MSTNTQETEVVLKVNSQQAQQKLQQLEDQAKSLRKEFTEAFKNGDTRGISEVNKKLQQVNKEMNNLRTNAANIKAVMVRLDEASPRELQRTIKIINNELNSGRVRRGSKEWDEYIGKLKEAQTELRKVKAEMAVDSDNSGPLDQIKEWVNGWGATAAAAMGAFAGVTMAGKAAVQAYSDMEAEEANVRKFTGMTAEEVARLNGEFKSMDTRTAREDLNKLAQEAGRLGKNSVEDVMGFVRAADQINVALDDLGDGATLTLSKLTGIFGDEKVYGTEQSLLKVGSVINELSQNCSASAPYLAEFSSRIGGIAAQSNMTISQVMAFAAVLDTQNLAVEASSTAVGQLITKIYQEPAEIAKAARLDVAEFSKMVKTDMNGALVMLFEHLNKFGGMENLASVFDEMGTDGARAIPVLTALAGHVEELKSQQEEAARAFREGISVTNEFAVQNSTVEAQLDKSRKGFNEMAVSLGEELLPVMRHCISGTTLLMRTMSVLIGFFIEHKKLILTLTVSIAAYNIAITAYNAKTKLAGVLTRAWTAAQLKLHNVAVVGKVLFAALANAVQYFTNGLEVNYAMQNRWRTALSKMKFAHWTGLVIALGAAVYAFSQRVKGVDEETAKFNKSLRDSVSSVNQFSRDTANEKEKLDELFGALDAARKGSDEYNKAKENIINSYGAYISDIIDENGHITDLAVAYDRLTESIRLANLERGIKDSKDSIENNYIERLNKLNKSLTDTLADYGVSTREAYALTAKVTTALNLGIDLDKETKQRLNEITAGGRKAVNGNSSALSKLMYNGSAAVYKLSGGVLGFDFADSPAEIVNKMFNAFAEKKSAINQVDVIAREANPLRDIDLDMIEYAIESATEAVEKGGGSVLRISDALAGTMEYVSVDLAEAQRLLGQYNAEKLRRSGGHAQANTEESTAPKITLGETEKERKEREKKEREAAKKAREALKKELDEAKSLRDTAEAQNIARYATGLIDFREYSAEKERIEKEYADKVVEIHEKHNKIDIAAYGAALKSRMELQKKHQDEQRKFSLQQLDKDHREKEDKIVADFYNPSSSVFQNERALNQSLLQEDLRYLKRKKDCYAKGSQEAADIQKQIDDRLAQDKLAKQKELVELIEKYRSSREPEMAKARRDVELAILEEGYKQKKISEEEYLEWKERINERYELHKAAAEKKKKDFAEIPGADGTGKTVDLRTSSEKKADEIGTIEKERGQTLAALKKLYEKGEIDEKTYLERRVSINKEANEKIANMVKDGLDQQTAMLFDLGEAWFSLFSNIAETGRFSFENLADAAGSTVSALCAGVEMYTQFAQAQAQIDIANTEAKYDAMIQAAGNNKAKVEQLEKEKEEKVKKIKAEAQEKEFQAKIVEAIAQTAQNAINAYGAMAGIPVVGPALAAAAAAAATAMGMVQIALIKKQQQAAKQQGYYSGGFTDRDPDNRREVGVVHANEFVANHKAVANPALSPVLSLIDRAQRTNTVGSLTAADVSNALGQGRGVSARGEVAAPHPASDPLLAGTVAAMADTSAATRRAIDRLSDNLEGGIETYVIMDGEQGLHKKLKHYERLIQNPKR